MAFMLRPLNAEPAHKKIRSTSSALLSQNNNEQLEGPLSKQGPLYKQDNNHKDLSQAGGKNKRCVKFFSTSGCPYGEHCHFQHFVSGGSLACTIALNLNVTRKRSALMLHLLDPSLLVSGYKTKLCSNYNAPQGCKFGEHCHYAHGKSDQRTSPHSENLVSPCSSSCSFTDPLLVPMDNLSSSLYYGEPIPPGVSCKTATTAVMTMKTTITETPIVALTERICKANMCIDAAMAGFIIGRAGGNVRQISKLTGSKLSIREHSEGDCKLRDIEMEGLPHQVDGAQEMIKLLLQARNVTMANSNIDNRAGPFNYKTKLCSNFKSQGACSFADHCHFAHGAHELRSTTMTR